MKFISNFFNKIAKWYKCKFLEQNINEKVSKLKWIKEDITVDKPYEWGHADSVEFDIEAIKTRKETIIDIQIPQKEVEPECVVLT